MSDAEQDAAVAALLERLGAATGVERIRIASELLAAAKENRVALARTYFRAELQDTTVNTAIGPVRIIGGTFREMARGLASDGLKAGLIPLVPRILSSGVYLGREESRKDRGGIDFAAFHYFQGDDLKVGGSTVSAGVTVVERHPGTFEFALTAYGLGHSGAEYWRKKIGDLHPLARAADKTPMGAGEPALDAIMPQQDDDGNLMILAVRESPGLLDSVTGLARAKMASELMAKVREYRDASGRTALERLRIARDITTLVARLGGGRAAKLEELEELEDVRVLRKIVAGGWGGDTLQSIYDLMADACAGLAGRGELNAAVEELAR